MKNHFKSINTPKSWIIPRIRGKYTFHPTSSGHPFEFGLPLGIILRDILKLAQTAAEVKKLLCTQEILVDGRKRTDHRVLVGLFDVISIPLLKKSYRVVLDSKGRIIIKEIPAAESNLKPCKIIGKTILPGGKVQVHLHDGKNIILSQKVKVGDTIMMELPGLKVKAIFPLQLGAAVFLTKGKHSGDVGQLKIIIGQEAVYTSQGKDVETSKEYVFVLGEKTAQITL